MKKVFCDKGNMNYLVNQLKTHYRNKYYNLFMSSYKWKGIPKDVGDYIMKKFWADGTVAAFHIKYTEDPGFTPYLPQQYNMYDGPSVVELVNKYNVPIIPDGPQIVNKDVVIGWVLPNHKPIKTMVEFYIDRLVAIDLVINTNLEVHKIPFVVASTPEDVDKLQDMLNQILDNQLAVFGSFEDIDRIKTLATGAPYIIDKLYTYRCNLESELMTQLGLDNVVQDEHYQHLNLDQTNSNNQEINQNQQMMTDYLEDFCDNIQTYLGCTISVEETRQKVTSIMEGGQDPNENLHTNE